MQETQSDKNKGGNTYSVTIYTHALYHVISPHTADKIYLLYFVFNSTEIFFSLVTTQVQM